MPPVIDDDRDIPRFSWYLHWRLPEPRLDTLKERTNGARWCAPISRARVSWMRRSDAC